MRLPARGVPRVRRLEREPVLARREEALWLTRWLVCGVLRTRRSQRGPVLALGRLPPSRVRTAAPPSLPARSRAIPQDLVAIVGKAMARAAGDRYASAGELVEDFIEILRGARHRRVRRDKALAKRPLRQCVGQRLPQR